MSTLPLFSQRLFLDQLTPIALFHKLKQHFGGERLFLFESGVSTLADEGNFSYIIVGAKERLWHAEGKSFYTDTAGETREVDENPLLFLKTYYRDLDTAAYKAKAKEIGVGFVDGFIGTIGYDMVQVFEPRLKKVMEPLRDPLGMPDLELVRPRLIFAYSHKRSVLTMIASDEKSAGEFPAIEAVVKSDERFLPLTPAKMTGEGSFAIEEARFKTLVEECKEEIGKGEIFQILLANRFTQPAKVDPLSFYRVLRSKNPSPYLYLLEVEGGAIAGSSPEVMIRLQDGEMLLRPIAGTRKRGATHAKDKAMEEEMLSDAKERAEHIMLVDLGRNDLGRAAKKGTVKVEALMRVERYSHVMHMVSDVTAQLREDKDMFDLFMAVFTAGTMTGAPKIRAMELIAGFEGQKRGFYSGSIIHFGFTGNMDSAITIRTSLITEENILFHAGAGVVADSQPELEWLEVNNKMAALRRSFEELLTV